MTGFVDDFDDDVTVPTNLRWGQQTGHVDDFDDDVTMPVAQVQPMQPRHQPLDDFDDDVTVAARPGLSTERPNAPAPPRPAPPLPSPPPAPRARTQELPRQPVQPVAQPQANLLPPPRNAQAWTPPKRPTAPPAATAEKRSHWLLIGIAALVALVFAAAIVFFLFVGGNGGDPALGFIDFVAA